MFSGCPSVWACVCARARSRAEAGVEAFPAGLRRLLASV